ncbi:MAG: hypothetical protein LUC20_00915, partial [Oscillospiraceae bacterium]|nr:hypothetical protein [Oscillospiraceae bacterium]
PLFGLWTLLVRASILIPALAIFFIISPSDSNRRIFIQIVRFCCHQHTGSTQHRPYTTYRIGHRCQKLCSVKQKRFEREQLILNSKLSKTTFRLRPSAFGRRLFCLSRKRLGHKTALYDRRNGA